MRSPSLNGPGVVKRQAKDRVLHVAMLSRSITSPAVQRLCGLPERRTQRYLGELAAAGLLQRISYYQWSVTPEGRNVVRGDRPAC